MLNVSYITKNDTRNIHSWSGIEYHLSKSLEKQDINFELIGNLQNRFDFLFKAKQFVYALRGRKFLRDREPLITKYYAEQVMKRISTKADLIFSTSTLPVAYVKSKLPTVIYTDSTFGGMLDYYTAFKGLCNETIKHGHELEKRALDKCSIAIFSSAWAAETAMTHYGTPPDKIRVIPFGANLTENRTLGDIKKIISAKSTSVCKLVFIGVDWDRKGGALALETAKILNENGLKTELHIVGIEKLSLNPVPDFVINHGFVSKSTKAGKALINKVFQYCHFLILPTKADCTPIVFSEACSFGLPCISTQTGGITSIIRDEENGKTFPLTSQAKEYADYIHGKFQIFSAYKSLSLSSFGDYENRLNWKTASKKIAEILKQV
jgi:glycosyltransferase involved in cell wall biosynthesis